MPSNKNKCTKCGDRHLPPTGKKCKLYKKQDNELEMEASDHISGGSDATVKHKHVQKVSVEHSSDSESDRDVETSVQMQILQELKRVNKRLDAVEDQVAGSSSSVQSKEHHSHEQSKLSSLSPCNRKKYVGVKSKTKGKKMVYQDSDSDTSSDSSLPSLSSLRTSVAIQKQVDARLRELECLHDDTGTNCSGKLKSKRGGPVDVLVKHKVSWPHEAILGGVNRTRITYDQLSITQWVQGFTRNILDEKDVKRRMKMLSYMSDLMEDATDFSWQGAKAAHAVLLCEIERGTLTWEDTARIDRVRRAHAQKHVSIAKSWSKSSEGKTKPWYCRFFQLGTCKFDKDHEVGGKLHRHICAACIQVGKVAVHPEKECTSSRKQSKNV